MSFSGLSTNKLFSAPATSATLIREDISAIMSLLSPVEAPILDWLGDADVFAASTKHEYIEDFALPHYITVSTAVNSATANTGVQINGLGEALTVGTLLENETDTTQAAEILQVASVVGANSVLLTRAYGGTNPGSLAAGGQLYVRGYQGIEGQDHDGTNVQRYGRRTTNTVGYFNIPVAVSGTEQRIASATLGRNTFEQNRAKLFAQVPSILEKEVVRGVLNSSNSLGSATATRTMKGIRGFLTTINSQVTASSFSANPHLYLGNVWQQQYINGASPNDEWAIIAGHQFFRDISNLNDTKVQDSNARETFKRVIREYQGPFGLCSVFLARTLPATELLIVSRQKVKVPPLQGSSFFYQPMGVTGDNEKGAVIGEYTTEVHQPEVMARLRS